MNLAPRGVWLAVSLLFAGLLSQWLPEDSLLVGAWRWPVALALLAVTAEGMLARATALHLDLAKTSGPLRLGRDEHLAAELANDSARTLKIDAYWPLPEHSVGISTPQRLMLSAQDRGALRLDLIATRLGPLALSPLHLRQLGRFGLAWWSRRLRPEGEAPRVKPDLLDAGSARAGNGIGGDQATLRPGAGTELLGLREYRPGDPMRAIAWKSAARRGRLQVREWAQEEHLDVVLVLDVGRASAQRHGALTRLHHSVNIAARLAERAVLLGDRVSVIAYSGVLHGQTPLSGGAAGVRAARALLAGLRSSGEESDPLAAAMALRQACRVRALVIWFTDAESGVQGGALLEALRWLAPKHFSLVATLIDPMLETLARQRPLQWQDPQASLAAAQMLEAAERSAKALARLGCETVAAVPERLDNALLHRYRQLRARRRV